MKPLTFDHSCVVTLLTLAQVLLAQLTYQMSGNSKEMLSSHFAAGDVASKLKNNYSFKKNQKL